MTAEIARGHRRQQDRGRDARGAARRAAARARGGADGRRPAAGRPHAGQRRRLPRRPRSAAALDALAEEYDEQGRGFELRNVAGGWRYYTREEFAPVVERFVLEGQQARLTQAALETLAVVAYKQPVSRSRVSAIRGVNVDGVMRTLLNRGLVEEAGTDHETGAHLYRTSSYFLERIGVTSIDELPELAPFLPGVEEFDDELDERGPARRRLESDVRRSRPTTKAWSGCRSCSPSQGSPAGASARS